MGRRKQTTEEACSLRLIGVKDWWDFESKIQWLDSYKAKREENGNQFDDALFRGHNSWNWRLETTLERSFPLDRCDDTPSLVAYYRKITTAQPAIETFTDKEWRDLPDWPTFQALIREHGKDWLDLFLFRHVPISRYMIYLRHHGFPSPLLDWTASPYVAALFAFDQMQKTTKYVCVYAFLRDLNAVQDGQRQFILIGPYVQAHLRHFLQQSRYSMCVGVSFDDDDYFFRSHESAMQGELFKFKIPADQRNIALKRLDLMNINPYSVFGSEDALVRTIARRECLFKEWRL